MGKFRYHGLAGAGGVFVYARARKHTRIFRSLFSERDVSWPVNSARTSALADLRLDLHKIVAVFKHRVVEGLLAVDEESAAGTFFVLDDPVTSAIPADAET